VRAGRQRGAHITCDVTPHHFAMSDEWILGTRRFAWEESRDPWEEPMTAGAYDSACRVNPPLPSRDDARALLAAIADGTVDAIATDHAPHPAERKLVPFAEAAPGMVGLETALSLALAAVEAGALTLQAVLAAMSTRPAAVIGLERSLRPGQSANLVVFDPEASWRVERKALASRSANTPLRGMRLPGAVALTVAEGRVTWYAGQLTRVT
jgi:dihydroorotase